MCARNHFHLEAFTIFKVFKGTFSFSVSFSFEIAVLPAKTKKNIPGETAFAQLFLIKCSGDMSIHLIKCVLHQITPEQTPAVK
jgi:hypothetical protein